MSARRLFLDDAPGERRGAVFLDGRPERLIVEREDALAVEQPGALVVGRVRRFDPTLSAAFIDLGSPREGLLSIPGGGPPPPDGQALRLEVMGPAREDKGVLLRGLGPAEGPPRLLEAAPSVLERLRDVAPEAEIIRGVAAREAADVAEEAALRVEHALSSGGRIFVETTRALTAVDVDLGRTPGTPAAAARRANAEAVVAAARVLRLKGLGGVVVIDLLGRGHDGAALQALARQAFEPEGKEVVFGRISRLGLFEIALPRRWRSAADLYLGSTGAVSATTGALRLLRRAEDAAAPGLFVTIRAPLAVARRAQELERHLRDRIGPRFRIVADETMEAGEGEVHGE